MGHADFTGNVRQRLFASVLLLLTSPRKYKFFKIIRIYAFILIRRGEKISLLYNNPYTKITFKKIKWLYQYFKEFKKVHKCTDCTKKYITVKYVCKQTFITCKNTNTNTVTVNYTMT